MEVRCGKVIRVRQVRWNPKYWTELNESLGLLLRPAMRQLEETWA